MKKTNNPKAPSRKLRSLLKSEFPFLASQIDRANSPLDAKVAAALESVEALIKALKVMRTQERAALSDWARQSEAIRKGISKIQVVKFLEPDDADNIPVSRKRRKKP